MILPDVNVLVYAHREDAVDHARYRRWLEETIHSGVPYGISDHALAGFRRIVTHPRVLRFRVRFRPPSTLRARCAVSPIADWSFPAHVTGKFLPAFARPSLPPAT
jgi:predicted nucleic acid-binding protein